MHHLDYEAIVRDAIDSQYCIATTKKLTAQQISHRLDRLMGTVIDALPEEQVQFIFDEEHVNFYPSQTIRYRDANHQPLDNQSYAQLLNHLGSLIPDPFV